MLIAQVYPEEKDRWWTTFSICCQSCWMMEKKKSFLPRFPVFSSSISTHAHSMMLPHPYLTYMTKAIFYMFSNCCYTSCQMWPVARLNAVPSRVLFFIFFLSCQSYIKACDTESADSARISGLAGTSLLHLWLIVSLGFQPCVGRCEDYFQFGQGSMTFKASNVVL